MSLRDAVVIGGGIVGMSLARHLALKGVGVTVVTGDPVQDPPTSQTSYAWINSHNKNPEAYFELNLAGLRYWRAYIAESFPEAVAFRGNIEVAVSDEHKRTLHQRFEVLKNRAYHTELITMDQAAAAEPVRVASGAECALFPYEGHAYPLRLIAAYRAEILAAGGRVVSGHVDSIHVGAKGVTCELITGATVEGDVAAVCAGNGSPALLRTVGYHLPMVDQRVGGPAFGYLGRAAAPSHGLSGMLTLDGANIRPNGPDELLIQCLDLDVTAGGVTPAELLTEYQTRVDSLLTIPAQVKALVDAHRVIPADGFPVVGPVDDSCRVWTTVTHSGVVLGPWLGNQLSDWMLTGHVDSRLAPFLPDREGLQGAHAYAAPRRAGEQ